MAKRRHRGMERRIALERMEILLVMAEKEALGRQALRARRYVELARRLGMRYNVRMPPRFRRRYCRKCLTYFVPAVNARVRVGDSRVTITCLSCGLVERYPYREEQAIARSKRRTAAQ
jgi:ribonuclease P protein subunit RPR2